MTQQDIQNMVSITPEYSSEPSPALIRWHSLMANNRIEEMQLILDNERYIFDRMALAGQITLFFSQAGSGKTLLFMSFIIDAVNKGIVNGEDVYYINADDNGTGLVTKTKIADTHGFYMMSPDNSNISREDTLEYLDALVDTGEIANKVIIIDTLKKFADMMSKASNKALFDKLRRITAKGGTVILAGHANKNKDQGGNLIYEGTADTRNDVDCVYSINLTSEPEGTVTVDIVRDKCRGDNVYQVSYAYTKMEGLSYQDMINSVRKVDTADIAKPFKADKQHLLAEYESERLFVIEVLTDMGQATESDIISCYKHNKNDGLAAEIQSENRLRKSLKELDAIAWTTTRGMKNAKVYRLIEKQPSYIEK